MNKLIKNEFKKLFSKKIMYILFAITILMTVLTNILYSIPDKNFDTVAEENIKMNLSYIEKELNSNDLKTPENKNTYLDLQTNQERMRLELNYGVNTWQAYYIENDTEIYSKIRAVKENEYNNDQQELEKAKKEYNAIKAKLDSDEWRSLVNEQLKSIDEQINILESTIKETKDKNELKQLNVELENVKVTKQTLEWRLEKNISYEKNFLSDQIEIYISNSQQCNELKYKENKTKEEKDEYNNSLGNMNISKYYIENNINIENENNAGYVLKNFMTEYGIIAIIFGIIIAGTIVSNESQKGTVKLLLTRPYSRNKILLAKYIVSILSIFIFMIAFVISQYVVGGIIQGFDGFKIPVVIYDLNLNSIVVMNVFKYLLIQLIANLPIFILLSTLAFALSTITSNSAISVALPILGYMMSSVINVFMQRVKILKYFVTANWDLSLYLFGGNGLTEGFNCYISLIICLIYLAIMLITTFITFNKRDIKNV